MSKLDGFSIKFNLALSLMIAPLISQIYIAVRFHLLGAIPESSTFNIVSQLSWLQCGYEVLSEGLVLTFISVLERFSKRQWRLRYMASQFCWIVISIYLVLTVVAVILAPEMVNAMQQQHNLVEETIYYIRLSLLAECLAGIYGYFMWLLILKKGVDNIYFLVFLEAFITIFLDLFLFSEYSFSFQLGVTGVALSRVITNIVLAAVSLYLLKNYGIKLQLIKPKLLYCRWVKEWLRIAWKSGIESLLRNAVYIVMILQMINVVKESDTYFLASNFIWGWLLVPVIALGKVVVKYAAAEKELNISGVNNYLLSVVVIIILWLITAPMWPKIIGLSIGDQYTFVVSELVYYMVYSYVFFAFNHVINSFFYGKGRTDFILYKSFAINIMYYGVFFFLYKVNVFLPTCERILDMFRGGMIIDMIFGFVFYFYYLRTKSNTKTLHEKNRVIN